MTTLEPDLSVGSDSALDFVAPSDRPDLVIESHTEEDGIASGWPRPFYLKHGKLPRPVQWITHHAAAQIESCSVDRTYTAGRRFACSCCAGLLTSGVLIDLIWIAERLPEQRRYRKDGSLRVDVFDGHYGSPLCIRCALFALTVCPHFMKLNHAHGDALQWTLVTGAGDYQEYDESSVVVLTEQGLTREKVTTGWLREQASSGQFGLTGDVLSSDDIERRPPDFSAQDEIGYDANGDPYPADSPTFTP